MALAIVHSRANIGIEAPLVTVEVHLSNGLPAFNIVGLPETAVKESKERVRSAIINSRLDFPMRRITVNLAPADLPKAGGRYDLAIALGILAASRQIDREKLTNLIIMGELALSGEVRYISGALPGLIAAQKANQPCIVPEANAIEAALLPRADIRLCRHLLDILTSFRGDTKLPVPAASEKVRCSFNIDFSEVVGQENAKRALVLAAAGGHNLLMRGPPGTGKTMLASRLITILPPLTDEQALEVAAIRSISGKSGALQNWHMPPFRSPHHTSSAVALVGGGSTLNAGEISLAHHGVLFLDELPEFSPRVLEVLREPLEAGSIQIARARYQVRLPASFQLVAAMNPCPCGYHGDSEHECRCTRDKVSQYQQRVSGPLLDRIDLQVNVPRLADSDKRLLVQQKQTAGCDSSTLRETVCACREVQLRRTGHCNALLTLGEVKTHCALSNKDSELLTAAMSRLRLSARAGFRILKIARTIADLAGSESIAKTHLLEAINYRRFDAQD